MEIRDPIHGLIKYEDQEEKILNSKIMQRLRRIKQLALANLVYPGANHTRFEHSIGVMAIASKMADKLELDDDRKKLVRLASLLHDMGHGPFSHVSEQVLSEYIGDDVKKNYDIEEVHEIITIELIRHNEELIKAISDDEVRTEIINLLKKSKKGAILRTVEKDIISGPLDSDKLDYLLRDSHYTGVKYGIFDLDKVIDSLIEIPIGGNEVQVGIEEEGVYAVEQLLLALYHMNVQVWRHRCRRITDAMVVRGIKLAIEEGVEEIKRLYSYSKNGEYIDNYLLFDDEKLVSTVLEKGGEGSKEYFRRLYERKLLKEVYSIKVDSQNFPDDVNLSKILNLDRKQVNEIEPEIAKILNSALNENIDHEFVVIDKQSYENPTFKFPQIDIKPDTIMVIERKNGHKKRFDSISNIFDNPSIRPFEVQISIYAPLDNLNRSQREDAKTKVKSEIDNILKNV